MMTFRFETTIHKPLEDVVRLYRDRKMFPLWHPGLMSDEELSSSGAGKKYKLTYKAGRRKLVMTETLLRKEPLCQDVKYELKGVSNLVSSQFSALAPDMTRWHMETTFQFRGLMKLISVFMRSGFEHQSRIIIHNFKSFAEGHP
jgi:hypothetical protein